MKTKTNPYLSAAMVAAAFIVGASQSATAQITFLPPSSISAPSDVITVGTLLSAFNWSSTQTVNGVAFTKSTVTNGTLSTNISLSNFGGTNATAFTNTSTPFGNLDATYKAMLVGAVYNTASGTTGTVSLNSLTTGHRYTLQLWVSDPRSGGPAAREETITGGNARMLDFNSTNAAGGVGQFATGYFTAGALATTFTLSSSTATSSLPQINAIQLREITNLGGWTGNGGATWDTTTSNNFATNKWDDALAETTFDTAKTALNGVVFADVYFNSSTPTAVAQTNLTIAAGGVSTGLVSFTNSAVNYTLTPADTTGITGTTTVSKSGTGTLTLTGPNTHSGDTTVMAGTLALTHALALQNSTLDFRGGTLDFGTLTSTTLGGLSGNQALSLDNATPAAMVLTVGGNNANTTYSGIISGTGTITKTGAGTLTLSGANTYTGKLTISQGTLAVGGTAPTGSTSTALGASGTDVELNGGNLSFTSTAAGFYTNDIIAATDSTITVKPSTANMTGSVSGSGNITLNTDTNTLTLSGDFSSYSGTFTINSVGYGGVIFQQNYELPTTSGSSSATFVYNATATTSRLYMMNNNNAGTFYMGSLAGTSSSAKIFSKYGRLGDITLELGALNANTSFAGSINNGDTGTTKTALTKVGTGTQTLTGVNTYSGATSINAGTLEIGGAGSLASGSYTNTVSNNAAFLHSSSANQTLSGIISGTGTLTKTGSGILTLSAANTYSGTTTINGGRLSLTGSAPDSDFTVNSSGAIGGEGTVKSLSLNDAQIYVDASTSGALTTTNGLTITGTTSVNLTAIGGLTSKVLSYTGTYTNTGSFVLANASNYRGGTFNNSGSSIDLTLVSNPVTWNGTTGVWDVNSTASWVEGDQKFYLADTVTFNDPVGPQTVTLTGTLLTASVTVNNTTGNDYTFSGTGSISGGGLTKTGTGTLTLATVNTYTGPTIINGGTLVVTADGAISAASHVTINSGGTLFVRKVRGIYTNGALTINDGGTLHINNDATNVRLDLLTLEMTGGHITGTFVNNTYWGLTAKTVNIHANTTPSIIDTVQLFGDANTSGPMTFNVDDTAEADVSGIIRNGNANATSLVKSGLGTLSLSGVNTYTGTTTINAGILKISDSGKLASSGTYTPAISNNGAFIFDSSAAQTLSGVISGTGSLSMSGSGTLILGGTNTYTGTTSVSGGILRVNGSLATESAVTVGASGTLGGTGLINGPTTISGTVAPGASVGRLLTSATTFDPGSSYQWEIANWTGDNLLHNDWDLLDTLQLAFNNTAANKLTIHISGSPADFTETNKTFPIAVATDATSITNFDVNAITIDASGFTGTGTWAIQQNNAAIELVYTAGNTYATWASTNAGGQAANLDYDGDGVSNGVEYFMGVTTPGFTANPAIINGKVTWPMSATFTGSYVVQTSNDLVTWTTASTGVVETPGVSVEYTLPTGDNKRFARIEVIIP